MEPYVDRLLFSDELEEECSTTSFCTGCRRSVCLNCCTDHGLFHPHAHGHAHADQDTLRLQTYVIGGSAALSYKDVKLHTLGYDWNQIQRVPGEDGKYLVLRRHEFNRKWKKLCQACNDKIISGKQNGYCSPSCKLLLVDHGGGREIVQSLVQADYQTLAQKDRLCKICLVIYSASHCPDHTLHHAGGGVGEIVHIVHYDDGRVLVPEDELPGDLTAGVMRVAEDGMVLVPVRPGHGLLPHPAPQHICSRQTCLQPVNLQGEACSVLCRHE